MHEYEEQEHIIFPKKLRVLTCGGKIKYREHLASMRKNANSLQNKVK